jgi:hypothetical protein
MSEEPEKPKCTIRGEFGRPILVDEETLRDLLDDPEDAVGEIMSLPLQVGNSFHPCAFQSPETIREATIHYIIKTSAE